MRERGTKNPRDLYLTISRRFYQDINYGKYFGVKDGIRTCREVFSIQGLHSTDSLS